MEGILWASLAEIVDIVDGVAGRAIAIRLREWAGLVPGLVLMQYLLWTKSRYEKLLVETVDEMVVLDAGRAAAVM